VNPHWRASTPQVIGFSWFLSGLTPPLTESTESDRSTSPQSGRHSCQLRNNRRSKDYPNFARGGPPLFESSRIMQGGVALRLHKNADFAYNGTAGQLGKRQNALLVSSLGRRAVQLSIKRAAMTETRKPKQFPAASCPDAEFPPEPAFTTFEAVPDDSEHERNWVKDIPVSDWFRPKEPHLIWGVRRPNARRR
jgi:hypothetical protein